MFMASLIPVIAHDPRHYQMRDPVRRPQTNLQVEGKPAASFPPLMLPKGNQKIHEIQEKWTFRDEHL